MSEHELRQPWASAVLRPARPGDAAAIARVHVDTWRSTYAGLLPDRYLVTLSMIRRAAHWGEVLSRPSGGETVIVASEPAAGVVGFLSFGPARRDGWPPAQREYGEVFMLYVEPDHQGAGFGRMLLEGGLALLAEAGFPGAVVWVLDGNPSRFFYHALGAKLVTERTPLFAGVAVRELGYQWSWSTPGEAGPAS